MKLNRFFIRLHLDTNKSVDLNNSIKDSQLEDEAKNFENDKKYIDLI